MRRNVSKRVCGVGMTAAPRTLHEESVAHQSLREEGEAAIVQTARAQLKRQEVVGVAGDEQVGEQLAVPRVPRHESPPLLARQIVGPLGAQSQRPLLHPLAERAAHRLHGERTSGARQAVRGPNQRVARRAKLVRKLRLKPIKVLIQDEVNGDLT